VEDWFEVLLDWRKDWKKQVFQYWLSRKTEVKRDQTAKRSEAKSEEQKNCCGLGMI